MAEITVTEQNFEEVVLKSELPVMVDFWATWCGPCRMLAPTIEEIAEEWEGRAVVGKINVDEQMALAVKYGINSIPTVIVFKNGEQVAKAIGLRGKDQLVEMLSK